MPSLKLKHKNDSVSSISLQGLQWQDTAVTPHNFIKINAYFLQENTSEKKLVFQNIENTNRGNNYGLLTHISSKGDYYLSEISRRGISGLVLNKHDGSCMEFASLPSAIIRDVSTCVNNYYEDFEVENIESGLNSIVNKIINFSTLKQNWDSYGAKPILWDTIFRAISFFTKVIAHANKQNKRGIPVPFVAPVANGGICFEWRTCFREFILEIPENVANEIEYLMIEFAIDGDKEIEGNTFDIDPIVSLTTDWLF